MTNNINIKLPSGDIKSYPNKITPSDIAAEISISLKKNAIISKVNNELWDLDRSIDFDCDLEIITERNHELLEVLRHDAAHVMAEAVLELYPETQITIGPAINDGFYYDFYKSENFSPKDLELIEKRMHEIVNRNEEIIREVWTREEAINFFKKNNEKFKLELIDDIPEGQEISFYKQGNFIDLCRGPHFKSTKNLGHAFKLTKLAGAYWRGDSNKETLQRIYGTAFFTQKDLDNHLLMLEEAEKRDHRKLGKKLQLFHMQEEATGSVFWHPKGWSIFLEIEAYMRRKLATHNYNEVKTPQVIDRTLWERSGHWDKFKENMFMVEGEGNKILALKPMNCPGHVQIFKQGIKSYKDLPIRMSEFGSCHRNEPSGALHGIMRVRQFTQDDAHIFCTDEQITEESLTFCDLLRDIYKDFGFDHLKVKFSDRPEVRAGSDQVWDKAEKALTEAVKQAQLEYDLNPGEGAFYGPKLEFVLIDAIGREWQCGTLQMDFVLPERLGATYIDKNGEKKNPVMLHRAILGSMERWLGILIEQYSGRFPLWLSPIHVFVCTITEKANEYALGLIKELENNEIRCNVDLRNEKIGYKIREHSENGCPIILIVGEKEKDSNTVAIRRLGSNKQDFRLFKDFLEGIKRETKPPDLV
ncbi:threonine--tRNA ligase [Alphaproteobacteria bacterium]|nr:threonine--tRNA ligase [Alphaproteobacteria bacterium]